MKSGEIQTTLALTAVTDISDGTRYYPCWVVRHAQGRGGLTEGCRGAPYGPKQIKDVLGSSNRYLQNMELNNILWRFRPGLRALHRVTKFFVEAQIVVPPPRQIEPTKHSPTAES